MLTLFKSWSMSFYVWHRGLSKCTEMYTDVFGVSTLIFASLHVMSAIIIGIQNWDCIP